MDTTSRFTEKLIGPGQIRKSKKEKQRWGKPMGFEEKRLELDLQGILANIVACLPYAQNTLLLCQKDLDFVLNHDVLIPG